jgi:hypothetical protein
MSTPIRLHHVLLLLALHGCASEPPPYVPPSAPAHAQQDLGMDVAAPGDTRAGRGSGVHGMSYDELLACGHDKARITALEKKLRDEFAGIEAYKKAVDAEGAAIESGRRLVDAHSQQSVDNYNARIGKYQTTVRTLNGDVAAYNTRAADFGTDARGYSIKCNNRPYRESDREKLPENLRDLIGQDSKPFDLPVVFDDDGHQTVHIGP